MADDPELAAIRARRMAEMQAQGAQGAGGGVGNAEQYQKQQEAMQREKEMKNSMLSQILDQSARARLSSISLVKPEKGTMIENMLIQMARSGQIGGKITEDTLVNLLEKVNKQLEQEKSKVTINRRRYAMDSDDDDYWKWLQISEVETTSSQELNVAANNHKRI